MLQADLDDAKDIQLRRGSLIAQANNVILYIGYYAVSLTQILNVEAIRPIVWLCVVVFCEFIP